MSDLTSEPSGEKPRIGLPPGTMTESHRLALKEGRERGQIVRHYLQAIESTKPRRGRPITPEGLRKSIEKIDADLAAEKDPLRKLDLVQSKIKKQKDLEELESPIDLVALETEFIRVAKSYNDSKELSPEAWLELGVPREVLRRAGILEHR
ncbi:MAG: hypothetical protein F2947_09635 [Actinobacteria bacterium]|jgi:hypothetical protein|uniref:Unannotated protein n=1 Tax=freshwater metagenome TaxID=449393 RepID=A0A6J6JQQ4_9ZZZZ|nr:hypothetical protein [Actinomycetota bacterium]MSW32069.1 hypothetical protein [Actinomycetota bacterium]MSX35528.1 hypothetical protein [Actinomycetota bacterium]MSY25539.1 hypothetical protein [Actinomycetota bacterium]MSY33677.1 hypothetical protein [Actinomycetota bacterium]